MPANALTDNAGNVSATTGTGPIVIGAAMPYCRSIGSVLSNGNVRTFFCIDKSGTDYMLFTGTYTTAGTSISVDTVHNGSNGVSPVSWTGGNLEVMIVARADDLGDVDGPASAVNEGVPVFDGTTGKLLKDSGLTLADITPVDIGDLSAADTLDGTEVLPAEQGGLPVKITTDELLDTPITHAQGYTRNKFQFFTQVLNTKETTTVSTDGNLFDLEPLVCHVSGSGTVGTDAAYLYNYGIAACKTNATNSSRAGVRACLRIYPNYTALNLYIGMYCGARIIPVAGTRDARFIIGWTSAHADGHPDSGVYFYGDNTNANWRAIVRNTSVSPIIMSDVDTGVAIANVNPALGSNFFTPEIIYDYVNEQIRFYINGVLKDTRDINVHYPAEGTTQYIGGYCYVGTSNVTTHAFILDSLHVVADYAGFASGSLSTGTL